MSEVRRMAVWSRVLVAAGLVLLGRPVVFGAFETWRVRQCISNAEVAYDALTDDTANALFEEAILYNRALLGGASLAEAPPYGRVLASEESGMIAHLVIPSLSLDLPVYRGTEQNTLMAGVGHVEGTALPVGTLGGRCVLAGHSGMPNAPVFDEIDSLVCGDVLVVRTLGRAFAYRVVERRIANPTDTQCLLPEAGRDLLTLVTCTPYGINMHRLLVTAQRCPYVPAEKSVPKKEVFVNRRTTPLLVGMAAVCVVAIGSWRARSVRKGSNLSKGAGRGGASRWREGGVKRI